MPLKKIIIHPGLPKTGTTSIQNTLFHNNRILERSGFSYMTEWPYASHSVILYNLFQEPLNIYFWFNVINKFDEKAIVEQNELNTKKLLDAVKNSSCETLILSGEDMTELDELSLSYMQSFFEQYFSGVEIEIVFYIRHPVGISISAYQQVVPLLDALDINKMVFEQNLYSTYIKCLGNWLKFFGSRVKVYKFEDAVQHPNGLIGHFLNSIGFPEDEIQYIHMTQNNESRSMEAVEFLGELHRQEPYFITTEEGQFLNPRRHYSGNLESPFLLLTKPKFDFSFEGKKKIAELSQADMRWLEEATGIHYDLSVAPSTPVETYGQEAIEQFAVIFPMLTKPLQEVFLDFFQKKYRQTGEKKIKQLFSPGSKPWKSFEYTKQTDKLLEAEPKVFKTRRMIFNHVESPVPVNSALLYINYNGEGYSDKDCMIIYPDNENRLVLKRTFSPKNNVKQFLLHPSYFSCVAILKTFVINGKEQNYNLVDANYDDHFEDTFVFFRDGPKLEFAFDEAVTSIDLELIVDTGTYPFSFCAKKWGDVIDQRLAELRAQSESEQQQLAQLRAQSESEQHQLAQLRAQSESEQHQLAQLRAQSESEQHQLTQLRARLEHLQQQIQQLQASLNNTQTELAAAKTIKGCIKNVILVFLPPNSKRRAVIKKIYFALRGWPVE